MVIRHRLAGQVAAELRTLVTERMQPGAKLPPEAELAERYDVSRNTVREALLALWEQGLVVRRWGVGTFVREASTPGAQSLSSISTLDELVAATGVKASLAQVEIALVQADEALARTLAITTGESVWRVARVIAIDGTRAFLLRDWFLPVINGRAVDPAPLRDVDNGLLPLLRDAARVRVARMEAELDAVLADADLAGALAVEQGDPLIATRQVSTSTSGQILIYSENVYNTRVSALHVVRTPRH